MLGLGNQKTRLQYTAGDLDLLAEVADQVGTIVSLNRGRHREKEQICQFVVEAETKVTELMSVAEEGIGTIKTTPDPNFVKIVEGSLRNLSDYIKLRQSPLADQLNLTGKYHTDPGQAVATNPHRSHQFVTPRRKMSPRPLTSGLAQPCRPL